MCAWTTPTAPTITASNIPQLEDPWSFPALKLTGVERKDDYFICVEEENKEEGEKKGRAKVWSASGDTIEE
jgi:hypothetical protein